MRINVASASLGSLGIKLYQFPADFMTITLRSHSAGNYDGHTNLYLYLYL